MAYLLIAEADDRLRQHLQERLTRDGHDVDAVDNGFDGYDALEHKAYDIVLTGLQLEGLDGLRLGVEAEKLHPDIKVIFLAGFIAIPVESCNLAEHYEPLKLPQPFHLNQLSDKIWAMADQIEEKRATECQVYAFPATKR